MEKSSIQPPVLQRQIDSWSCGLYDLMAMKACAAGVDFTNVIDDISKL